LALSRRRPDLSRHQGAPACGAIAERGLFDFLFLGDGLAANLRNHPILYLPPGATDSAFGAGDDDNACWSRRDHVDDLQRSLHGCAHFRVAGSHQRRPGGLERGHDLGVRAGGNFGRAHPNHELRYEIAEEFINVVRGLWDCWSDKAIIADLKTGKFFDESQVKPLNHEGPRFSVKGPINMGRSPQGQPLVLQAGGSERGQNLAARTADVVFSVVQDFEEAKVAYSDLKERIRRFGRDPDSVTILPGVMPIIGKTDAQARDVLNTLQSYVDSTEGLAMLSARLGTDISKYPLDGPIPDLPIPDTSQASPGRCWARASARTCRCATSTTSPPRRADTGSFAVPRRQSPIRSKSGSWKAQRTVSV
jgi:Coenzyme F420-dependent N5,N10-methylene tetrahydromethanopterin reductase and related flavin-dependent oxidoreductases